MITKSEIEVVIARLRAMPDNALVSAGFGGVMDREQLIEHVKNADKDEIGKKIVEAHLNYMRSLGK